MSSTPSILSGGVALVLATLASTARAQTPPTYAVEFLGSATSTNSLNAAGVAIGWTSGVGSSLRGWVAGPGMGVTLLPLPPGRASSMVFSINDLGLIVGDVATGNSPEFSGVAAIWTPNSSGGYDVQELGALPGTTVSHALAINNLGDIVGYSVSGSFHKPVLFTAPGGIQDLSATGIGDPKSINDLRVLIDGSARRLDLNTMVVQNLGVPTGFPSNYVATFTNAINAGGQVVGAAVLATSGNCSRQAARYSDGIGWQIFSSCGQYNDAHDINDSGDVVMRIATAPYVRFEGLGTYRVEDLIANTVGHWSPYNTFYSIAINNSRQIVLPANNPTTGESGMVLLTPITEVGTSYCFGDGTTTPSCPCSNFGAAGNGCANSGNPNGALLQASGTSTPDTVVLSSSGELPNALTIFLQGDVSLGNPVVFGSGLRCAAGNLKRIGTHNAVGGASSYPQGGDPSITARSAALGDPIGPGATRYYLAYYRDPNLIFCTPTGFNATQGLSIVWN